jgi:hypothetical protein
MDNVFGYKEKYLEYLAKKIFIFFSNHFKVGFINRHSPSYEVLKVRSMLMKEI